MQAILIIYHSRFLAFPKCATLSKTIHWHPQKKTTPGSLFKSKSGKDSYATIRLTMSLYTNCPLTPRTATLQLYLVPGCRSAIIQLALLPGTMCQFCWASGFIPYLVLPEFGRIVQEFCC
jgi:hypothetical protein